MSETSPRDQAALRFDAIQRQARQPRPGELLFEFRRGDYRYRCELRNHGPYGVEAQFLLDGSLHIARLWPSRGLAVLWAEHERRAIEGS